MTTTSNVLQLKERRFSSRTRKAPYNNAVTVGPDSTVVFDNTYGVLEHPKFKEACILCGLSDGEALQSEI